MAKILGVPVIVRTRVARQMVGLFLACAVLPVLAMAAVTWLSTRRQLEASAQEELRSSGKLVGMVLFDRLSRLETLARTGARDDSAAPAGFVATPAQRRQLADGRAILVLGGTPDTPRVHVGVAAPGDSTAMTLRWASVGVPELLGSGKAEGLTPYGARVCVRAADRALGCTGGKGQAGGAPLAAEDLLFLSYGFAAPSWTIRLERPADVVLQPLAEFERSFVQLLVATLLAVLVLAQVQIRRRLDPLARLHEATRRAARNDFAPCDVPPSANEFTELAEAFNRMLVQLGEQWRSLQAINATDSALLAAPDRARIAAAVLAHAQEVAPADQATLLLGSPRRGATGAAHWTGFTARDGLVTGVALDVQPHDVGELDAAPLRVSLRGETRSYLPALTADARPVTAMEVFPLRAHGELVGALMLGFCDAEAALESRLTFAATLAHQVSAALTTTQLLDDLRALNDGALAALARTIDANSSWTAGHTERVTRIAVALAAARGMDAEGCERVRRGALLHDLGKIGVPAAILDKPTALTPEERRLIERHPVLGAEILGEIAAYADILPIVRHHHERWDGEGYPDRLRGSAIPEDARLVALADTVDALLSARPYREGWALERVLEYVRAEAGRQFDPELARHFVQLLRRQDSALFEALFPDGPPGAPAAGAEIAAGAPGR